MIILQLNIFENIDNVFFSLLKVNCEPMHLFARLLVLYVITRKWFLSSTLSSSTGCDDSY